MPFDPTSKDDKAQLYQALKAIAKLTYGDTVDFVIDRAIGQPVPHGDNWQRNYRRGEYNSTIAQITYRWIEKHHFVVAHEIAPDIFPNTAARQWRAILNERADDTRLKLVLVPSTLGVIQRDSQLKAVDQVIKHGQRFCFELDSDNDGYAIALKGHGDRWEMIPLGMDGKSAVGQLQKGINRLPQDLQGNIDPISEDSDEGISDFVIITAATNRIPVEISHLIKWANENECALNRRVVRLDR